MKWVLESSFIDECNDRFGTPRFRAPVVQRLSKLHFPVALSVVEFCFLSDKGYERRTISLGVGMNSLHSTLW